MDTGLNFSIKLEKSCSCWP